MKQILLTFEVNMEYERVGESTYGLNLFATLYKGGDLANHAGVAGDIYGSLRG